MIATRALPMLRDQRGATSAEFVLVLPVFLILVFGLLDIAGYAWNMNMIQKATQYGARVAAVTTPVAPGLSTQGYVGQTVNGVTLTQGDVIPKEALGLITCTGSDSTCRCTTAPCPGTITFQSTPFTNVFNRMKGIDNSLTAANLTIEYRGSGLGYAGDPSGMEISPLVTVKVSGQSYRPWMGMIFNAALTLPEARYTLTMEDGTGTQSF